MKFEQPVCMPTWLGALQHVAAADGDDRTGASALSLGHAKPSCHVMLPGKGIGNTALP